MQASPYWEIAAGYVGAMRAEIPFTSLYSQAVSLTLDETLITIRPRITPLEAASEGAADKGPPLNPGMASSLVMLKTRLRARCTAFRPTYNGKHSFSAFEASRVLPESIKMTTDALGWCTGLDPAAEEALGGGDAAQDPGWGDYGLGEATVMDGVRLIAGGIENVLQRLRLQVWPRLTREVTLTFKANLHRAGNQEVRSHLWG